MFVFKRLLAILQNRLNYTVVFTYSRPEYGPKVKFIKTNSIYLKPRNINEILQIAKNGFHKAHPTWRLLKISIKRWN